MMQMELALRQGRTLREFRAAIGCDELARWAAYYRITRFGEREAEQNAALIAMCMCRMWGKNASAKIEDYMRHAEPRRTQTVEEQEAVLLSAFRKTRADVGWE